MRPRLRSIVAAFLLDASILGGCTYLAISPGCASVAGDPLATSAARAQQYRIVYYSALNSATALAPRMSLAQAEQFETSQQSAYRLLLQWDQDVHDGKPFSGFDSFMSTLTELASLVASLTPQETH